MIECIPLRVFKLVWLSCMRNWSHSYSSCYLPYMGENSSSVICLVACDLRTRRRSEVNLFIWALWVKVTVRLLPLPIICKISEVFTYKERKERRTWQSHC